jgi:hypothetical protein
MLHVEVVHDQQVRRVDCVPALKNHGCLPPAHEPALWGDKSRRNRNAVGFVRYQGG